MKKELSQSYLLCFLLLLLLVRHGELVAGVYGQIGKLVLPYKYRTCCFITCMVTFDAVPFFSFWTICVTLHHFLSELTLNQRTAKKELLQHCVVMLLELLFKGNATLRAHAYINVSRFTLSPLLVLFVCFLCNDIGLKIHLAQANIIVTFFLTFEKRYAQLLKRKTAQPWSSWACWSYQFVRWVSCTRKQSCFPYHGETPTLTIVITFVCLLPKCLVEVLKAFPDAFVNADKKKNFCSEVCWWWLLFEARQLHPNCPVICCRSYQVANVFDYKDIRHLFQVSASTCWLAAFSQVMYTRFELLPKQTQALFVISID